MRLSAPVGLPFQALMNQPGDVHLRTAEEAQCLHCAPQMWPKTKQTTGDALYTGGAHLGPGTNNRE